MEALFVTVYVTGTHVHTPAVNGVAVEALPVPAPDSVMVTVADVTEASNGFTQKPPLWIPDKLLALTAGLILVNVHVPLFALLVTAAELLNVRLPLG